MKAVADLFSTRSIMDDDKNVQVDPLPPPMYGRRDLAELFGVTPETIRAWEQKGSCHRRSSSAGRAFGTRG